MAEPHWTGYVGMATGIIGSVTGITGAIMGYLSYRKSNNLKALDFRLELRKAINDVNLKLVRVRELMDKAARSRQNLNAARGIGGGAVENWKAALIVDRSAIAELSKRLQNHAPNNELKDAKDLESELVAVHKLQGKTQLLIDKYLEAINLDEKNRKEMRADDRVLRGPHT